MSGSGCTNDDSSKTKAADGRYMDDEVFWEGRLTISLGYSAAPVESSEACLSLSRSAGYDVFPEARDPLCNFLGAWMRLVQLKISSNAFPSQPFKSPSAW
jgi:hypothetical protein